MDSSRRAVEAYWRSRMIDGATADEDKVAAVYKLEEICELLRSSHVSIVKEVSEYILKRLDHKSPIVKQKALRLIKYSVGKSGVEFRREMQRHSAVMRQLFHYKGQLDPLKGDALNKAVRDTAHEAVSAIFASEDNKPAAPSEDLNRRIQGFGNTNFEMQAEDKKSFLSEVVGLGSASIKQGLSTFTAAHSTRKSENGSSSYKSPNLRRSLTTEMESPGRYEREDHHRESWESSDISKTAVAGSWSQDSRVITTEATNGDSGSSNMGERSREEKLLETIVTSGGVRLQPTRDALQVFLAEASKLDAMALSFALEMKLQSHLWQVRMKAVCVLESILRKKDDAHFSVVASYFSENKDVVVKCSESPQGSLREKANKVLSLLGGDEGLAGKPSSVKSEPAPVVQMPDLIDTGDQDEYGREDSISTQTEDQSFTNLITPSTPVIDDLFGDSLITEVGNNGNQNVDDPFAGVSFHTTGDKEPIDDLFSGLTVDDKQASNGQAGNGLDIATNKYGHGLFDVFSSNSEQIPQESTRKNDMHDLLGGLSVNEKGPEHKRQGTFGGEFSAATFLDTRSQPSHPAPTETFNGLLGPQMVGVKPSTFFPLGPMQYNIPPNLMFNQAFGSQAINYNAMGSFMAQQQLLATMSNFQHFGNLSTQGNTVLGQAAGDVREGGYVAPLPDIFHPTINPIQSHSTVTNSPKKEETKAFDFISDHLSAARDSKSSLKPY
eukprot:TRINITY_DN21159_c0_g1_i1.p1 TRINITY_DN21159_c0_g1~~TRINITY_DN21159_c0_g1_i1.p1  ORF type:complete len:722 (-),score=146.98 TRINITY_DN21159_c0_g1_i1:341-2506(-)